jgi:serine/threonine-protein phosphatase 2B catalytic subunit
MSSTGPFPLWLKKVSLSVTEMFHNVLIKEENMPGDDDGDEENDYATQMKSKMSVKNKIQFVSKMLKMQKLLREQNENILAIKALNNNKLPQGILLEGKEALEAFSDAKNRDSENEMRPRDSIGN